MNPFPDWIAKQLPEGIQRKMYSVGPYQMHVMEIGEGYPVWMQHGNPTWGFLYRKIVQCLPLDRFRIILPDLIGLGFSSKPRDLGIHTLRNHSAWIEELLQQLDLPNWIFVGQDWGGPIGIHAQRNLPERMQGMVVLNTTFRPPKPNFRPTTFHKLSQMPVISDLLFRGIGFPQIDLGRAQGDPQSISGAVSRAYRFPLKGWKNNAAPLALARMVPDAQDHPSVEPLREIEAFVRNFTGPVEMVWGEKDPVLGRIASSISKLLPQAELEKTDAGHFLQEEVPELIAAAIIRVHDKILAATTSSTE